MIKNFYGDEILLCNKTDSYGGVDLSIRMVDYHKSNLTWLDSFRKEYETEKKLREESPAVKNAWEQYQVVKALTKKETTDA